MITRFYVDNYKCLVNFEYRPKPMELIIGGNGSGKTTVFEALDKVREFLNRKVDADEIFPISSRTKWVNKSMQVFEFDIQNEDSGETIQYRLEIRLSSKGAQVEKETVRRNGELVSESFWKILERSNRGHYTDSYISTLNDRGESRFAKVIREDLDVPLSNPNQTMMSVESPTIWETISFCKINPPLINPSIGKMEPRLSLTASNFASYYLYTLQQKQGKMFDVIAQLREVLPGFDSFSVEEDFEEGKRELNVIFRQTNENKGRKSGEIKFSFDELSDGQRALIVLYTLVLCEVGIGATLIIDEPENYIGLKELQPLILLMEERVRETGGQILLISHNREFINMLTDRGQCVRFYRENNGHTRIAAFQPDSDLAPAEIVASGMEDDE